MLTADELNDVTDVRWRYGQHWLHCKSTHIGRVWLQVISHRDVIQTTACKLRVTFKITSHRSITIQHANCYTFKLTFLSSLFSSLAAVDRCFCAWLVWKCSIVCMLLNCNYMSRIPCISRIKLLNKFERNVSLKVTRSLHAVACRLCAESLATPSRPLCFFCCNEAAVVSASGGPCCSGSACGSGRR